MSLASAANAAFNNKILNFEQAFHCKDSTSQYMKAAISDWFFLYYNNEPTEKEDPSQRLPFTVVNKLTKTVFSEYEAKSKNVFADALLTCLCRHKKEAMQQTLIGGEAFLKPLILNGGFEFSVIPRRNYIVLSRNELHAITDIGTQETTEIDGNYFTLLERRTIGQDGKLTIISKLYSSKTRDYIGSEVPLNSLDKYAALEPVFTLPQPIWSLGLIPIKTPVENCVDGTEDGVSVYAPAAGLIHSINVNEKQINIEFENGESRIVVSNDLMKKDATTGRRELKDHIFTGLDDDPENIGVTIFSPALREQSFLNRKQEYLRNIESLIGFKRGILSDVQETDKTATEITNSAGDYNLSIIDFQEMWEDSVKESLRVCSILGQMYSVPNAVQIDPDKDVEINWGDGVLFDRTRTWTEYQAMVAGGMLKPEIAIAWYFDLPFPQTEAELEKIRTMYMPQIEELTKDTPNEGDDGDGT